MNELYAIARCELHSSKRHGHMNTKADDVTGTYIICMESLPCDDVWDYCESKLWMDAVHYVMSSVTVDTMLTHWNREERVCRNNWENFCNKMTPYINDPYYKNINIVKKVFLNDDDGHMWTTTIIKTFWLKLIQRKWKKICVARKRIMQQRMSPNNLFYRQLNGHWPREINHLPSLKDVCL